MPPICSLSICFVLCVEYWHWTFIMIYPYIAALSDIDVENCNICDCELKWMLYEFTECGCGTSSLCDTVVVVVRSVCCGCVLFPWRCGLVHQRCVCRGAEHRWEAAQRVSLFLTAPLQQATPTGAEGSSHHIQAPPIPTPWFTHLDAVSCWFRKNNTWLFPIICLMFLERIDTIEFSGFFMAVLYCQ